MPSSQFMFEREHAPGPRGSPQLPQGLGEEDAVAFPPADTAKTESRWASLRLSHLGH
jgi:hypothetical protein